MKKSKKDTKKQQEYKDTKAEKVSRIVSARDIDYKNVNLLKKFLSGRKKIQPQSATKLSASKQRKLRSEIKKARIMGLLPFTDTHSLG